jgi:hypothetical protein
MCKILGTLDIAVAMSPGIPIVKAKTSIIPTIRTKLAMRNDKKRFL